MRPLSCKRCHERPLLELENVSEFKGLEPRIILRCPDPKCCMAYGAESGLREVITYWNTMQERIGSEKEKNFLSAKHLVSEMGPR